MSRLRNSLTAPDTSPVVYNNLPELGTIGGLVMKVNRKRKISNLRDALFQTKCLLIPLWHWGISLLNPRTTEKAPLVDGGCKGPVLSAKSTLSTASEYREPLFRHQTQRDILYSRYHTSPVGLPQIHTKKLLSVSLSSLR